MRIDLEAMARLLGGKTGLARVLEISPQAAGRIVAAGSMSPRAADRLWRWVQEQYPETRLTRPMLHCPWPDEEAMSPPETLAAIYGLPVDHPGVLEWLDENGYANS